MRAAPEAIFRQVDEEQVVFWVSVDGRSYRAWGMFRGRHIDARERSRSASVEGWLRKANFAADR